MRTFLVTRPLVGFLPPIELGEGLHIEFLQAIPLFDEERTFNAEFGVEALLQYWEREEVPFWSSVRGPAAGPGRISATQSD
jgi:hypothetical protein